MRKATATLTAGKVACVNSGTYNETGASAGKSGTKTAPIVLKRTPGSRTRPVIRLTKASSVLRIDRGYWIVDGLEFNLNRQRATGMVFGPSGHHIALRNSYVHDDARGAAVYVSADDVSIEGSEIANNFHYLAGQDSHGITVFGHAARVLVRGNRIHDNGGDGLQCADETDEQRPSDGQLPSDVTIEDNRFWTSPANQGRIEQAVDIKTCRQVSIRGSVRPDANDPNAANQKFYGFKSPSSAAGGSGAMVIHLGARNVLVENNRIWDSCHGVGVGRHDTALGVPANVVVRRNAMFDLKAIGGACKGYGIGIQRVDSADVYHNTLDRVEGSGFRFKHGTGTAGRSPNVDFFNNIVRDASSFLDIATREISGFGSDHNLFYWSRDANQSRFRIDGVAHNLNSWQAKQNGTSVLLADRNSRVADPLFVPGAGTTDDYYTQAASPARDRALDNTGAARFGAGPDLGFRETYGAPSPGVRCDTAAAGAPWPGEAFAPQSGKFTATLDATPLGAPIAAGVGLSKGTAQHWTDMAAIVRFDDVSGNIDARDGATYTAARPIPYQANAKYRVRFVVDVAARRYSAYVTPPGGNEITIGTNLAFRTEQQAVTSLDTRTVAAGIGSLQACNLRISDASSASPSVAVAGDIAGSGAGDEATAKLLDTLAPTKVLTTGDNAYESGTLSEFNSYYDPTWGRHKAKTSPAAGNHEYKTSGASGYFDYFGAAAGERQRGYYSFNVGAWHFVALNSNCSQVGGCGAGSPQEHWLRADLAANPASCTAAYWHHPRFSAGNYSDDTTYQPLWQALYDAKADVVLNGHDHNYQRYRPMDPAGNADALRGIREFVVGTGGRSHYALKPDSDREVGNGDTYGVLKLTLHSDSYDWEFKPEAGKAFTDSGSAACH